MLGKIITTRLATLQKLYTGNEIKTREPHPRDKMIFYCNGIEELYKKPQPHHTRVNETKIYNVLYIISTFKFQ